MKKNRSTSLLSVSALAALVGLAGAPSTGRADETIIIKLGTGAPNGSTWHNLLKEGAQRWEQISGGRVKLKIFAGGTMGNEGDLIKKMRIGTLQAAALSTAGMRDVSADPMALDMPFMIQTAAQRECILKTIAPKLEASLAKKGFVVLNWSEIGFMRFFSKSERKSLAEWQASKMFSWEGDPDSAEAWRKAGFHPVVLSSVDVVPSLSTGMIDAVAWPPALVMGLRIHDKAPYMLDMTFGSLTGALVVDKRAWDKIPADLQPKLLEVTREIGGRTSTDSKKMEEDSLKKMKEQGLKVLPPADRDAWLKAYEAAYAVLRGKVVPADTFDEVKRLAKQCQGGK